MTIPGANDSINLKDYGHILTPRGITIDIQASVRHALKRGEVMTNSIVDSMIRPPAVAGLFYPADTAELRQQVRDLLDQASVSHPAPKAMIVPHAGYIYSGPVAASAYVTLSDVADDITRVVLIGPDHRVGFTGIAAPSVDSFTTPLGSVTVDQTAIKSLRGVIQFDQAHADEHSLEVHLPFLQQVLTEFELVPLVVGHVEPEQVARVLEDLWGGDETLIVVSSDLSHYHEYRAAQHIDQRTTQCIEELAGESLGPNDACGFIGVRALLLLARQFELNETTLDVRNSGDTAGDRDRVVGYGAYVFA